MFRARKASCQTSLPLFLKAVALDLPLRKKQCKYERYRNIIGSSLELRVKRTLLDVIKITDES